MKHYILALVVLFSLAAPAMAAELNATQISYTEMRVDGTGFTSGATVTLSTSTIIPVTPSGTYYSYEITGMYLPADSVLKLDASPVEDDLKLYVKKNWLVKKTFTDSVSALGIYFSHVTGTTTVRCNKIPAYASGTLQTIRVYGTTTPTSSNVNLSVTVQQNVTADGNGNFSELVDISAIPAGVYTIHAIDDDIPPINATTNTTIYAPGQLHHITITDPQTSELTLNTTGNYTFGATGYDLENVVVQNVAFDWWSSSTYIGTIDYTGYFNATNVGHTEVYARSGTKESNHVIVYVDAQTVSGDVNTGSGNATSGNSTAHVALNDPSVSGTVNITEVGDPVNGNLSDASGNDTNLGLGTGAGENQFIKGAVVNVNESIRAALVADAVNGTSWVHIRMEYDQSVIDSLGIVESTLDIWKYNETTHVWELVKNQPYCLENGRDMTANYVWVNVTNLSTIALVGTTKSSSSGGGGGGEGTYPPGWFGTPTPTPAVTPTPTPTPSSGVTPTPAGERVTPTPAKPAEAGKTPTAPAGEGPTKKDIPGFTAVSAIAGMLAIAYVVMRQRR
jgi:PGF-CTERM protein